MNSLSAIAKLQVSIELVVSRAHQLKHPDNTEVETVLLTSLELLADGYKDALEELAKEIAK